MDVPNQAHSLRNARPMRAFLGIRKRSKNFSILYMSCLSRTPRRVRPDMPLLEHGQHYRAADQEQMGGEKAQRGKKEAGAGHGAAPRSAAASATARATLSNERLAIIKASHTISRNSLRSTFHMLTPYHPALAAG